MTIASVKGYLVSFTDLQTKKGVIEVICCLIHGILTYTSLWLAVLGKHAPGGFTLVSVWCIIIPSGIAAYEIILWSWNSRTGSPNVQPSTNTSVQPSNSSGIQLQNLVSNIESGSSHEDINSSSSSHFDINVEADETVRAVLPTASEVIAHVLSQREIGFSDISSSSSSLFDTDVEADETAYSPTASEYIAPERSQSEISNSDLSSSSTFEINLEADQTVGAYVPTALPGILPPFSHEPSSIVKKESITTSDVNIYEKYFTSTAKHDIGMQPEDVATKDVCQTKKVETSSGIDAIQYSNSNGKENRETSYDLLDGPELSLPGELHKAEPHEDPSIYEKACIRTSDVNIQEKRSTSTEKLDGDMKPEDAGTTEAITSKKANSSVSQNPSPPHYTTSVVDALQRSDEELPSTMGITSNNSSTKQRIIRFTVGLFRNRSKDKAQKPFLSDEHSPSPTPEAASPRSSTNSIYDFAAGLFRTKSEDPLQRSLLSNEHRPPHTAAPTSAQSSTNSLCDLEDGLFRSDEYALQRTLLSSEHLPSLTAAPTSANSSASSVYAFAAGLFKVSTEDEL